MVIGERNMYILTESEEAEFKKKALKDKLDELCADPQYNMPK